MDFQFVSVAGTVYIKWKNCEEHGNTQIEAKLNTLTLTSSIKKFIPDTIQPIKINSLSYLFHCMFNGILI
ncbi:hypothetical protein NQ314_004934 [Rhamnusium bicolor]|uniref:Uncharacterized protein n=1 Tax=Rhamnusium bicolor TaxID=1586634 RepID=A0AAV8ZI88_9CUCU|nr:hypothetical protein NQ314_004934 [Rhamnusium bicolor]